MSSIGIIMSVYNGEKYLEEQLDSVFNSTLQDFNIYIVDDGSSDGTKDIIYDYLKKFPDKVFFVKNPENLGSTKSFLKALMVLSGADKNVPVGWESAVSSAAKCRYFMFSDQDDIWLKDKIALTYSHMVRMELKSGQHKPLLVFTDAIVVGENGEFIAPSFHKREKLNARFHGFNRCLMENKAMGCTVMVNRSLARMVKLPEKEAENDVRFHDWWLMLLASSMGKIKYVKFSTILYRQTGNNQVGGTGFKSQLKTRSKNSSESRERLMLTFRQAKAFGDIYGNRLSRRKSKILNDFVAIPGMNAIKKRKTIITHRFYKSGFLRNVGVMFLV